MFLLRALLVGLTLASTDGGRLSGTAKNQADCHVIDEQDFCECVGEGTPTKDFCGETCNDCLGKNCYFTEDQPSDDTNCDLLFSGSYCGCMSKNKSGKL